MWPVAWTARGDGASLFKYRCVRVTQGYVHIDEALKLAATRTCEEIASLLSPELDDNVSAREEAA